MVHGFETGIAVPFPPANRIKLRLDFLDRYEPITGINIEIIGSVLLLYFAIEML